MKYKNVNYREILASPPAKEYVKASLEIKEFFKKGAVETPAASKKYKKALQNYRDFLDCRNLRLPVAKYPIVEKDKNSFKYLKILVKEYDESTEYVKTVVNPDWIYFDKKRFKATL